MAITSYEFLVNSCNIKFFYFGRLTLQDNDRAEKPGVVPH